MLIGEDDISNDVITLGTFFFNVCLHLRSFPLCADWWKSDSSVDGEPYENWRWHSSSRDVVASSPSFSRPAVRAPRRSCARASLKGILNFDLLRRFAARIIFHNSSVPLLWIFAYTPAIWWKNCALRGKSTKFGMIIVLGLLNNISYGPQSGWGEFVLRGVWGGGCSFQINCCYWKESGKVKLILPYQ